AQSTRSPTLLSSDLQRCRRGLHVDAIVQRTSRSDSPPGSVLKSWLVDVFIACDKDHWGRGDLRELIGASHGYFSAMVNNEHIICQCFGFIHQVSGQYYGHTVALQRAN